MRGLLGSRLAPGAEIARTVQREVISRIYNVVARTFLHYGVVDAQCGFKAIRTSLARDLIPRIRTTGGSSTPSSSLWRTAAACGSTRSRCAGWRTTTPG